MPVLVNKYTCEFKCGHKATGDIKRMQAHENSCWNNPENKTCKTCRNEIYETDSDDFRSWIYRGGKLPLLDERLVEIQEELKGSNHTHIRPIQHCPFWNKENEDQDVSSFIDKVKQEIELGKQNSSEPRIHFPYYDFAPTKTESTSIDQSWP